MSKISIFSVFQQMAFLCVLATGTSSGAFADMMYFSDEDTASIRSANLDGSNLTNVITTGIVPRGVAIDSGAGMIYWANRNSPATIERANLDGTNVQSIITSSGILNTIALDTVRGKIYYEDSLGDQIYRANLNGTGIQLIASGFFNPIGIAVDPIHGHVYWTGQGGTVESNLDGTNQILISALAGRDVEVDPINGKIYLGGVGGGNLICSANLDGSDPLTIINSLGRFSQMGLELMTHKIYWSALDVNTVYSANLDGSDIQTVITSGLSLPRDIAFDYTTNAPAPSTFAMSLSLMGILGVALKYMRQRTVQQVCLKKWL